jgi:hypothetical protein
LEEPIPRQGQQLFNDFDQRRIGDKLPLIDAALADIVENQIVALNLDVLLAQRADPERLVLDRVTFAAGPEVRATDQAHNRRMNFLAVQIRPLQMFVGFVPDDGKCGRYAFQLAPFARVALLDVFGAVDVLLPPGRIEPVGLYLPIGIRRHVHISPRGRDP